MEKQTFYSVLFCLMLAGCAVIESSPTYSSEAIRKAELTGTLSETQQPKTADIDYYVSIGQDSVIITDPATGATVYAQSFDDRTAFTDAIIKDNE